MGMSGIEPWCSVRSPWLLTGVTLERRTRCVLQHVLVCCRVFAIPAEGRPSIAAIAVGGRSGITTVVNRHHSILKAIAWIRMKGRTA